MPIRIYGNRSIKTLSGETTRPTSSRVREALFNIWQGRIDGCRLLDLCTGSGAMGAEALCRGASGVVGIEHSANACRVIRDNWIKVASPQQSTRLIRGDVVQQLNGLAGQVFDFIYFDPPYASDLYMPVLQEISVQSLLSEHGELAVEHDRKSILPDEIKYVSNGSESSVSFTPSQLMCCRRKHYGRVSLTFYRR